MSKTPRRLVTTAAALLTAAALAAPAHAVYLEDPEAHGSSIHAFFEGLFGFLSSVFAAGNGHVIP